MIIGFLIVLVASFFLGTFGLGMKYNKPLSWEAFWGVHALVGMILIPTTIVLLFIPEISQSLANAPTESILTAALYGFIWAIGGMLFGMSVQYVGVSLTYGVVMGLCGALGGVIPLFQIEDFASKPSFPIIMIGVAIMLIGVAIVAFAGIKREKMVAASGDNIEGVKSGKDFKKGIVIVIVSGVFSACINIGFANALPVIQSAEALGTNPMAASFLAWMVVLWGGFAFSLLFSVFSLTKNKTWHTFTLPKTRNAYKWGVITAVLWFGSLGIYGIGASKMGELGAVIGWPVLVGLSLIFSNYWAIRAGEWKGAKKPLQIMGGGTLILIVATLILTYAGTLN
jgi:L-rhamnose-H+ transport protein